MGTLKIKQCAKDDCYKQFKKKYSFSLSTPIGEGTHVTDIFHYCSKRHMNEAKEIVNRRIRKQRVSNRKYGESINVN